MAVHTDNPLRSGGHGGLQANRSSYSWMKPGRRQSTGGILDSPRHGEHSEGLPSPGASSHFGEELDGPRGVLQPPLLQSGLRNLIESLDRKLAQRFDTMELRLERLGERIVDEVLKKSWSRSATPGAASAGGATQTLEPTGPEEPGDGGSVEFRTSGLGEDEDELPAVVLDLARQVSPVEPARYALRDEWQPEKFSQREGPRRATEHWKSRSVLDDVEVTMMTSEQQRKAANWWVVWPSTRFKLFWDLLTMVLVAYDMAIIPVNLAFDIDSNKLSDIMFWPTLVFWSADVVLSFFTGFYSNGVVEVRLWEIAKEYLRTWFLLDILMVGCTWSEVVLGLDTEGLGLGRAGKTLRIIRVIRSMRLLRLAKLRRIIEEIQIRITSEYFHIIVTVIKLSVIIIWMNHFLACCWWAIGMSGPSEGDADAAKSWTSANRVQNEAIGYQYFTSLHWSLTQFTPASMEIWPTNLGERIFAVIVLLSAMIVFSSFVSSITAAMTQLRQLSSTVDQNFLMLRRYLRVRNTPSDLGVRIIRCVEHRVRARESEVPESAVPLLRFLSEPLRMELLCHVYQPYFTGHPFFEQYAAADAVAMQRVCLVAVERISLSTGDALFTEARRGEQMFFLRSGRLRYYHSNHAEPSARPVDPNPSSGSGSRGKSGHSSLIEVGDWFCESSLWCPWAHWGTMMAMKMSEVLAVDAKAFARVTALHRLVAKRAHAYGAAFVERLNVEVQGRAVSDIQQLPHEAIEEMASHAFCQTLAQSASELDRVPGSKPKAFASSERASQHTQSRVTEEL